MDSERQLYLTQLFLLLLLIPQLMKLFTPLMNPLLLAEKLNVDLLQLADMYQLETLKLVCGEVLISKLEISNSISSFILVSRHFNVNTSVRKMMDMFMRCKAEKVVECDDWENITEGLPILAKDLVRVMVKGGGSEIHGCWFCNKNVNQMLF